VKKVSQVRIFEDDEENELISVGYYGEVLVVSSSPWLHRRAKATALPDEAEGPVRAKAKYELFIRRRRTWYTGPDRRVRCCDGYRSRTMGR
jgi:D-Tyr-tRNAtyr deacylase